MFAKASTGTGLAAFGQTSFKQEFRKQEFPNQEICMNLGSVKLVLTVFAMVASTAALAQKTQLTVYTALETDQIKGYESGFNKQYPDIELKWVRDSTGVI